MGKSKIKNLNITLCSENILPDSAWVSWNVGEKPYRLLIDSKSVTVSKTDRRDAFNRPKSPLFRAYYSTGNSIHDFKCHQERQLKAHGKKNKVMIDNVIAAVKKQRLVERAIKERKIVRMAEAKIEAERRHFSRLNDKPQKCSKSSFNENTPVHPGSLCGDEDGVTFKDRVTEVVKKIREEK